jgi:hypothetical protein
LICKCPDGHISFARELRYCGMKGCGKPVTTVSNIDIEWFYKINPDGLAIEEKDLHKILQDRNMPKEVKEIMKETFPELRKPRFWS